MLPVQEFRDLSGTYFWSKKDIRAAVFEDKSSVFPWYWRYSASIQAEERKERNENK